MKENHGAVVLIGSPGITRESMVVEKALRDSGHEDVIVIGDDFFDSDMKKLIDFKMTSRFNRERALTDFLKEAEQLRYIDEKPVPKRDRGRAVIPVRRSDVDPKINRNDPCPCGSGLKYKKCCIK